MPEESVSTFHKVYLNITEQFLTYLKQPDFYSRTETVGRLALLILTVYSISKKIIIIPKDVKVMKSPFFKITFVFFLRYILHENSLLQFIHVWATYVM